MNFWEDKYRVEEDGSVYNIKTNKKLKAYDLGRGYRQICLFINGKNKGMYIHRLLALTYIPNPDNKPQVDHIDRNNLNNEISNLRWVTHLENQQNKNIKSELNTPKNIFIRQCGNYQIRFNRNKLKYNRGFPKTCTIQYIITQRDLMLSMF